MCVHKLGVSDFGEDKGGSIMYSKRTVIYGEVLFVAYVLTNCLSAARAGKPEFRVGKVCP